MKLSGAAAAKFLPTRSAGRLPGGACRGGRGPAACAGMFGCLPVVEDGRLVGIVTEYDILRLVEELPPEVLAPRKPPAP